MITFDEDKQRMQVDDLYRREEEELASTLSQKYGVGYADLSSTNISTDALRLIPEAEARKYNIASYNILGKKVNVGVLAPNNQDTLDEIAKLENNGYIANVSMVSKVSLEKAWDRYKDINSATETHFGSLDISTAEIEKLVDEVHSLEEIKKMISDTFLLKSSYRITKIITIILAGALALKSSDVHIEPEENAVRIRFRLDGVLIDIAEFDRPTFSQLLSRIKLLSNLKLNVKDNAQDGRFSIKLQDSEIEIRVSLLPGGYGESIVMRVLNPKSLQVSIEDMGMSDNLYKILMHEINRPNGMILTTGPTGSGKTTTLYSFMRKVYTPELKIITIEDPIEYHLAGIVQTQTDSKKGYTFAEGLRASLRQDPDVIMVGEIRDNETAETAINSALTGHLVFSTLHTNNAAGTFTRLIDLGINPRILTSAINVAIAQRLVRKLCQVCRKKVPVPEDRKEMIAAVMSSVVKLDPKDAVEQSFIYEPVGCAECNMTGFRGRVGIFEAILTDGAIEAVVSANPSEREIEKAAEPQGIYTMIQDGIIKLLKGITAIDELERVIDLKYEKVEKKIQDVVGVEASITV
jgi:type IV pilus assembly protein PilB